MKNRKAFIVGIKGEILKNNEIIFLKRHKPWGVIIFSRNIKNIEQLKKLILGIKNCFKDKNYPILIDEEGGRVSRLSKIIDFKIFTAKSFGKLYVTDRKKFFEIYKKYIDTTSSIFKEVGININTVPVLDVARKQTHNIIGDRSFSKNKKVVSAIGDCCIKFYSQNKIGTVMKHIPGHGLAKKDSHFYTPFVKEKKNILNNIDFFPFKNKKTFFAMTGHLLYSSIDKKHVSTQSKLIIKKIIREKIKFKNIIISDDISMKSLKYSLKENILKCLSAGCNLILHCNGNMKEMQIVANNVPTLDKFIVKKTSQFYKFLI